MRGCGRWGVVLGCALAAAAGTVHAQRGLVPLPRYEFGVGGGLSAVSGDVGDLGSTGWHVLGTFGVRPARGAVGYRFDLAYHGIGSKTYADTQGNITKSEPRVVSATADAVFRMPVAGEVTPYFLAGIGLYDTRYTFSYSGVSVSDSKAAFGLNGGFGLEFRLSGMSTLLEARYHYAFDATPTFGSTAYTGIQSHGLQLIPVSVIVMFR